MPPPSKNTNKPHWSSIHEAGTLLGMRTLLAIHRWFGRRAFSIILFPVVIYFIVLRPDARKSSFDFLRTHQAFFPQQWSQPINSWHVFQHFSQFSETILDKILAWNMLISVEEFEPPNTQALATLIKGSCGQLFIGTHMGNLEFCRSFIQRSHEKTVNILVYDKHSANFVSMMHRINPGSRLNIYQVDEFDVVTVLKLREKISQGEWVFIAGDRTPVTGHQRTASVNFLGRKAQLPIGPYYLAHALACPVNLIFSYRYNAGNTPKIRLDIIPFAEKIVLSRKSRDTELQAHAQKLAVELEKQCQHAPFQWFNFFDFWATVNSSAKHTQ